MERRLAAILAADVVGYSRLMAADEVGTLQRLKAARRERIEPAIAEHHGRTVKLMGDGALIEFASVVDAVACAVRIQAVMAEHNATVEDAARIVFRIGINLGDVIVEGDDIYGDGVNVAARIEALAEPGGIAVSQTVRHHVGNKLGLVFADLGEQQLKNIGEPVRVWSVRVASAAPTHTARLEPRNVEGPPDKPSVAVLPFANISGDPEQDYFGDGIAEDIITDLSKISGLFVLARNTTFVHKGKAITIQDVSRQLGVRYVLEGSVRKAGNRVRITAQLIDGRDGGHLWADRFDRDLTDIFAVQDEITASIVEALKVRLLPSEQAAIAGGPTNDVEAYQHYLRGRQFFHRHCKRDYVIAKRMFEKAIESDPLFARAHAAIADCDAFLFTTSAVKISLEGILATSSRALSLAPDLAEAHASRGLVLGIQERFAEAEREFQRATELDPNLYEGWYFFGRVRFLQGRMEEAVALFERAAVVRPDDFQALALLPQIYRSLDRPAEALRAARAALERAERELDRHPDHTRAAYLGGIMLVQLGELERARNWLARALAIEPDDFNTRYNVACGYSLMGELDTASDLLEQALVNPHEESRLWVRTDSDLAPLREHPRFRALLARLGT